MGVIDQQLFCLLCAAAGVPNSKWPTAYAAIITPSTQNNYLAGIAGMALLDSAIRAWWKAQGGVILGTALIAGSLLGG